MENQTTETQETRQVSPPAEEPQGKKRRKSPTTRKAAHVPEAQTQTNGNGHAAVAAPTVKKNGRRKAKRAAAKALDSIETKRRFGRRGAGGGRLADPSSLSTEYL